MTVEQGMELGISIRGGAEHGLGIYVSAVDQASLADLYGIQVKTKDNNCICLIFYSCIV